MTRDGRLRPLADREIMGAGFASEGGVDQAIDRPGPAIAQRGAQVDMIVLAQAHIDAPLDGQADTVAARAEIVRQWGDEAQRRRAVLDREIARRAAGALRSEEHTSELQSLMRISF